MPFWKHHDEEKQGREAWEDIHNIDANASQEHKAKFSHELIAAAASYEAAKKYEEHVSKNGKPVDHAAAKALLAGFAGAFIDRVVETKGLDEVSKVKAHHQAKEHLENVAEF
ncbi:hypothetical protein M422DRAFT_249595 [Sphaerobolus stellatus SS14]|uniref:CipC-like antibiotic response protein n=1 Tax=Sphaerobolus stellatus (strain SS14) TaxID=990650 RepID=A0A0C9VHS6_SPHS4|nr:hypothetical protein M422DRAFT_249595 [Sphaerobolus stellatus SS14]